MNKRADLMNNVLTTIIAVVGLVIIFIAAWQLYSVHTNQEERNARTLIDSLEARINSMKAGETGKFTFTGFTHTEDNNRWFLVGWGKKSLNRPDKCYFKTCICICKLEVPDDFEGLGLESLYSEVKGDVAAQKCQQNGFCRLFDSEGVVVSRTSKIDDSGFWSAITRGEANLGEEKIPELRADGYIYVKSKIMEIDVSNSAKTLKVTYSNPDKLIYHRFGVATNTFDDEIK